MATADDLRMELQTVLQKIVLLPRSTERNALLIDAFYAMAHQVDLEVVATEKKR